MTLWLVLLARSGRFLGPLAVEVLLVILVYYYAGNPVRDSYGTTALYLVPLAAWMGLMALDVADPALRELAVARRGRLRTDLARLGAAALPVVAMALFALVAPLAVGAFNRDPTAADLVTGLLAHLACGAIGLGLAACAARPVIGRIALSGAAVVAGMLVIAAAGAPPMSLLSALHDGGPTAGPLVAAGGLALALGVSALALLGRTG